MISYAQFYEDVVLQRALRDVGGGFYVDVGAHDPHELSVTKHFYENGWSGINIEPIPSSFSRFLQDRKRDISLNIALGASSGTATIFEMGALSTLREDIYSEFLQHLNGEEPLRHEVKIERLDAVLKEYAGGKTIHFLKIDVEGFERQVLLGADFEAYRPWVICMESTQPTTFTPSHEEWETLLLDAGYLFATQVSINRFYVAKEHPRIFERLQQPIDIYRTAHDVAVEAETKRLRADAESSRPQAEAARMQMEAVQAEVAAARAETEALRTETEALRARAEAERMQAEALRAESVASHAETEALRTEAEALRDEATALRAETEALRTDAEMGRAQLDTLRAEAEAARGEAAALRAEAESLRAEIETLRMQAEATRAEVAASRAESDALRTEGDALRAKLEAAQMQVEAARAEVAASHAEAEALRSEVEAAHNEAAALRAEADGLRVEIEAAQLESEALRTEAASSQAEAESLRNELAERYAELETWRTEAHGLRIEAETLRAERARLQGKTQDLSAENKELRTEANGLKTENERLGREVLRLQHIEDDLAHRLADIHNSFVWRAVRRLHLAPPEKKISDTNELTGARMTFPGKTFANDGELALLIDHVYQSYLGRPSDPEGRAHYTKALQNGLAFSAFVHEIKTCPERVTLQSQKASTLQSARVWEKPAVAEDGAFELALELAYQHYLGRPCDPESLTSWRLALQNGMSLSQIIHTIKNSPERAKRESQPSGEKLHYSQESELGIIVDLVYRQYLQRPADAGGIMHYVNALRSGMALSEFVEEIKNCPEITERRSRSAADKLSDGEFISIIAELLFPGTGATPREIESYKIFLDEDSARRPVLVQRLIEEHIARQRDGEIPHDPDRAWILGTNDYLTPEVWKKKADELKFSKARPRTTYARLSDRKFLHSGTYTVSAIASLYRGRRYLKTFLENITSQSIFDRSELIIIDANSPEGEGELIAEYQKAYPNILYKRMDYTIGIYDAWNVGVAMARGRYLTNTNLDDLRRHDSFELQSRALDERPAIDVVYQDVYYSFDHSLEFDEAAQFGFKSCVPIVTPNNLLIFNSPHNAPMWRKKLHDEVGLFDTSYKSAGDWEFWLRCLSQGRQFFKITTPHVVYFQNPEGISTKADTLGIREGRRIMNRYARQLIPIELLMSRQEFADLIHAEQNWDKSLSCHAIVQRQLVALGDHHKRQTSSSTQAAADE